MLQEDWARDSCDPFHAGGMGWRVATKSSNVARHRLVMKTWKWFYLPGEVKSLPHDAKASATRSGAMGVPIAEFMAVTRIPIIFFYGDNTLFQPSGNPGQDGWRVRLAMARCGESSGRRRRHVVHLPEIGIRGNTHFSFSDLNNIQIPDELSAFLSTKKLG